MEVEKAIIEDIRHSAETNCVVKLKIKGQVNPVITAVEKFENDTIFLKPTCLYGFPVAKRILPLTDIEDVKRYKTHFDNPLFEKLRFVKNNISSIRQNFEAFQHESGRLNRA